MRSSAFLRFYLTYYKFKKNQKKKEKIEGEDRNETGYKN